MEIQLKRAYEPASETDGARILVDRLWPRGVSKEKLALTLWLKEIAPSTELRKWFNHDPEKWLGFVERYSAELRKNPEATSQLTGIAKKRNVTLVYGARDKQHNEAVVLKEFLEKVLSRLQLKKPEKSDALP